MRANQEVNNDFLREELNQITSRNSSDMELKEQIQQIASLRANYSHSITLIGETIPSAPRFNCYQYAFGLETITLKAGIRKDIRPGRDFVRFLVDELLDEVYLEEAGNGDHVLYLGSQIEHAGKINEGAVESKWGLGHLWRHGLYELPLKYGDRVRFFRPISPEKALTAFLTFHPTGRIEHQ